MIFKKLFANEKSHTRHYILAWLLVINLWFSVFSAFKTDAVDLEILRAGGKENFAAIKQFYTSENYKNQQKQAIDQVLQQLDGATDTTANNPVPTTPDIEEEPSVDTSDIKTAFAEIKKNGYIKGNPNARYTVIEYSDLECPFCKRHHNNGTLDKLLENYPNDVNKIYRHFPLSNIHPNAQMGAEATECVADQKGAKAFYTYIDALFELTSISKESVTQAAKALGYDMTKFNNCLEKGDNTQDVLQQLTEGQQLFGIRWTPGNVLVDSQTGRYVVIAGAYPYEKFEEELQKFLAE